MEQKHLRFERPYPVEQKPSLHASKEEQLAIEMVLELSNRFGLWQPHDVAAVLKVSTIEAKRLISLAVAKTDGQGNRPSAVAQP